MDNKEMIEVLKGTLYPDASDKAINMVLNYCKALNLDPMMKPVYIIKIGDRETLMPGIGLYRTQAIRTGNYAGLSEPIFGPIIQEEMQKPIFRWSKISRGNGSYNKREIERYETVLVSYPEWCKIIAKKLISDHICEFVSLEYWKENYATIIKDSDFPNDMWFKRPFGQLSKCAESQVLRKMCPEFVPQQPTYEEMEGKIFYGEKGGAIVESSNKNIYFKKEINKSDEINSYKDSSEKIESTIELVDKLKFFISRINIEKESIAQWFEKNGLKENEWDKISYNALKSIIEKMERKKPGLIQEWASECAFRKENEQENLLKLEIDQYADDKEKNK